MSGAFARGARRQEERVGQPVQVSGAVTTLAPAMICLHGRHLAVVALTKEVYLQRCLAPRCKNQQKAWSGNILGETRRCDHFRYSSGSTMTSTLCVPHLSSSCSRAGRSWGPRLRQVRPNLSRPDRGVCNPHRLMRVPLSRTSWVACSLLGRTCTSIVLLGFAIAQAFLLSLSSHWHPTSAMLLVLNFPRRVVASWPRSRSAVSASVSPKPDR